MGWWAKLSAKEKRLLYIAGFVIFLFLADRFVLQNALDKISAIDNDIEVIQKNIGEAEFYLKNKEVITQNYQKYSAEIKLMLQGKDERELQENVERVAKDSHVTVDQINHNKGVVQLNCSGKPADISNLLYKLYKEESVLFTVDKFSFALPKGENISAVILISQFTVPKNEPTAPDKK